MLDQQDCLASAPQEKKGQALEALITRTLKGREQGFPTLRSLRGEEFAKQLILQLVNAEIPRYGIEDDHPRFDPSLQQACQLALQAYQRLCSHSTWQQEDPRDLTTLFAACQAIASQPTEPISYVELSSGPCPIRGRLSRSPGIPVSTARYPFVPLFDDHMQDPEYAGKVVDAFATKLAQLKEEQQITSLCFIEKVIGPFGASGMLYALMERVQLPASLYRLNHWADGKYFAGYQPAPEDRVALVYDLVVTGGALINAARAVTDTYKATVPAAVVLFSYEIEETIREDSCGEIRIESLGRYEQFRDAIDSAAQALDRSEPIDHPAITVFTANFGRSIPPPGVAGGGRSFHQGEGERMPNSQGKKHLRGVEKFTGEEGKMPELAVANKEIESDPDVERVRQLIAMLREFKDLDLKQVRESFGLTQDALARIGELPVRTIWSWENHRMEPRISSLLEVLERLLRKQNPSPSQEANR